MESKGFFASLFDFSFRAYATPKAIPVLYGFAVAFAGIYAVAVAIGLVVSGFEASPVAGAIAIVGALIAAPLVFFLLVLYARVVLELMAVMFQIAGNTAVIAGAAHSGPLSPPAP